MFKSGIGVGCNTSLSLSRFSGLSLLQYGNGLLRFSLFAGLNLVANYLSYNRRDFFARQ